MDGQQRITTVYLLLAVIREQIRLKKHLSTEAAGYQAKLDKFLENDLDGTDDYNKLKVFSSKGDRLPTWRILFGDETNPKTPRLQTDMRLYVKGNNQVDEFEKYAIKKLKNSYPDVPSLWELSQVLLHCLKLVWIPLDQEKDDPQAIFESLNDKGMPLTASELLCNYLFHPIIEAKEQYEDLHNDQWLASIKILGDDGRFEEYLRHFMSIGETKMVGKHRKVYVHFKMKNRQLSSAAAKRHLMALFAGAPIYRTIVDPIRYPWKDERIQTLLSAISNTRMDSSTPFVLSVLLALHTGTMQSGKAAAILQETLVLLVRRKMTELATTQYDVMFPQLLGNILHEPNHIRAIHDHFRKHQVWVSDQDFEDAIANHPAYRRNDLAFSRMILVELDKRLQVHGQLPDYTTVNTIEHVIPQVLDAAWKTYLGKDAEDDHLPVVVHTIGNLCLLSQPANSSAGQNPFVSKKAGYSPITAFARQIKETETDWNISSVRQRSRELAKHATAIWAWTPE